MSNTCSKLLGSKVTGRFLLVSCRGHGSANDYPQLVTHLPTISHQPRLPVLESFRTHHSNPDSCCLDFKKVSWLNLFLTWSRSPHLPADMNCSLDLSSILAPHQSSWFVPEDRTRDFPHDPEGPCIAWIRTLLGHYSPLPVACFWVHRQPNSKTNSSFNSVGLASKVMDKLHLLKTLLAQVKGVSKHLIHFAENRSARRRYPKKG